MAVGTIKQLSVMGLGPGMLRVENMALVVLLRLLTNCPTCSGVPQIKVLKN